MCCTKVRGVGGDVVVCHGVCDEYYMAVVDSSKGSWDVRIVFFNLLVYGLKICVVGVSCNSFLSERWLK